MRLQSVTVFKKKCPFCNWNMVNNTDLFFLEHVYTCIFNPTNKDTKKNQPVICPFCLQIFKNPLNLALHKTRVHRKNEKNEQKLC